MQAPLQAAAALADRFDARVVHWARHPLGRLACAVVVAAGMSVAYVAINQTLPPRFDFTLPIDRHVPFLPWTLLIYVSYYPLFLLAALRTGAEEFVRLLRALLRADAVAYAGFALLTAHVDRPSPEVVQSPLLRDLFAAYHGVDAPGNSLPSLHVAFSVLVGARMRLTRGGWLWMAWAGLITLSTLTTRQHVVLDVVAGLAVAFWAYRAEFPRAVPQDQPLTREPQAQRPDRQALTG